MSERVISADDHIDLTYIPRDLWQKRLPAKYREAGPKVVNNDRGGTEWVREGKRWGHWGSKRPENMIIVFDKAGLPEEPEPGVWRSTSVKYRLKDMDAEGIDAQVLYNFLDWSFTDQELKSAVCTAFNSWQAEELCAPSNGRLIGLATLPAHDAQAAVKEMLRCQSIGLRGAYFDVWGAVKPIFDPMWEPLWSAAEESGMSINVHVGAGSHSLTKIPNDQPWKLPSLAAVLGMQLEEVLATMILSGVLDRHPKMKFVLGESGIGWIPYVLERLDYEISQYGTTRGSTVTLKASPREIFHRQCYATFSDEHLGVELISRTSADNFMWAADYPHGDGTFPHSSKIRERMFGKADAAMRRKILCDNAAKVYNLN